MVSCKTVKTNGTSPQAAFGRISHAHHPRRRTDKEEIIVILRTSVRFETQSTHTTTSSFAFAERSSFFLLQRRVCATRKDYCVASLTPLLWFSEAKVFRSIKNSSFFFTRKIQNCAAQKHAQHHQCGAPILPPLVLPIGYFSS